MYRMVNNERSYIYNGRVIPVGVPVDVQDGDLEVFKGLGYELWTGEDKTEVAPKQMKLETVSAEQPKNIVTNEYDPPSAEALSDMPRAELIKLAGKLSVKVDKRWSTSRMAKTVGKHLAAQ